MAKVELQAIRKNFGTLTIIPELNLNIESGEFVALVGPSGCGKSTILRMVAGLDDPSGGAIKIGGQTVNDIDPKLRGVAMVFQNYALYPHMTVKENMGFSLKMSKVNEREAERRIQEAADILGLRELLHRKPSQLSGGQKQRVAMGRAMVRQPKVLLFDEPLSNLDAQLRIKVRSEIAHLHRRIKSTVIYVTHDQVEAMTLADRIAILNKGNLEQYGSPLDVYHRPKTRFVASFIGTPPMNFLPADQLSSRVAQNEAKVAGFRPEITLLNSKTADTVEIGRGKVSLIEPLGSTTYVHLRVGDRNIIAETRETLSSIKLDDVLPIFLNPKEVFYFDASGKYLAGSLPEKNPRETQ